jgi:hypothetical protein
MALPAGVAPGYDGLPYLDLLLLEVAMDGRQAAPLAIFMWALLCSAASCVPGSPCGDDMHGAGPGTADGPPAMGDGPPRRDGPPDLAPTGGEMGGIQLMGLPNCPKATVTADVVFDTVVRTSCGGSNCHLMRNMASPLLSDARTLRDNLVGKLPLSATMPLITPGKIHESYTLYKIMNQQSYVPGGGGLQMPYGGMYSDIQRTAIACGFIQWIQSGAQ